jgi:hypothetical protein
VPYSVSVPFSGDTSKAFGLAESALSALGFRITQRSAETFEVVGPGMNSSRESALTGASRIRFSHNPGELALEAELGGVERMSRFVRFFPLGLCLSLAIVFSLVLGRQFGAGVWIVPAVVALPWLLIGPLMSNAIRARTCRGLDALVANMVAVGEGDK